MLCHPPLWHTGVRQQLEPPYAAPPLAKTEVKKPEAPRKTPVPVRGWKPEAIPRYRVISRKTAPPPAKATEHKGSPARPAPNARQLPKGAGDFTEARANSNAMHQLADQAVDKNGAFSPSALMVRAGAVFYDMSGALPAQKVGEAWGDPNGSVKDRVLSTGELGLAVTQYLPVDTGGLRGEKPLTEAQKLEIKSFAEELGMPGDRINFTSGNTGYVDDWDTLMVGTDVMPAAKPSGTGTLQANQRQRGN